VKNADIDTYAEIIKVILDNECLETPLHCIGEITMIGHSLGGYITLAFAEEYPQYLDSFGLFHSPHLPTVKKKKRSEQKLLILFNDKGPHAFLKTSIPGCVYPNLCR
jgi:pimeloyl-ACP methyl ester carboxylesterase